MLIVSTEQWGASPREQSKELPSTRNGWTVHYNGPAMNLGLTVKAEMAAMRGIERYHEDTKKWADFAYNFAIGQTGAVYEGRGWSTQGGHSSGYFRGKRANGSTNQTTLGVIFLIGKGEEPSEKALASFRNLVAYGADKFGVPTTVTPHRVAAPSLDTECPGDPLVNFINNLDKEPPVSNDVVVVDEEAERAKAEKVINTFYNRVLGREADAEGLKFWTDGLVEGTFTKEAVFQEFVMVRMEADKASFTAAIASNRNKGVDPEKLAEQAYRRFLDGLIALNA